MAEYGCPFALWGVLGEAPPTSDPARPTDTLEDELPISAELRTAILAWGAHFCEYEGGTTLAEGIAFDERGFTLSRQLQQELGPLFAVEFFFSTSGPHKARLSALAEASPLVNWRIHAHL